MLKKALWLIYQPYKWIILAPGLVLSTLFFGGLAVLLLFVVNPRITSLLCGVTWSRVIAYLTPMIVKVTGREHIDKKQSYVIVSNHQSHYDIFLLYGWLGVDFRWVMKQELRNVPALGIACERIGHIFIDRSNTDSAITSLNAAKKKIVNGTSILFFPEGTRSKDGRLRDFKKGAFKIAIDLGLPILPITINGTRKIMPSKTLNVLPGRVWMHIHKHMETKGYGEENISELMALIKEAIESGLKAG